MVVVGQIKIHQGRDHVPASFQCLENELQMIVHIVEERTVGLVQKRIVRVQ